MALGFQRQGIFGRKPMFPQDDILSNGPYGTPGFGDSWMQRQAEMQPINSNADAMPIGVKEMTKKPGFFQKGGFGQYALAALSDFGARLNDRDQNMLGSMMAFNQKKQMEAEEARLKALEPIKLGNSIIRPDGKGGYTQVYSEPKDVNPYRWEDNAGNLLEIDANGQPRVVYKDPTPKVTYMNVDNADGTKTVYPVVNGQIVTGGQPSGLIPIGGTLPPKGGSGGDVTGGFR